MRVKIVSSEHHDPLLEETETPETPFTQHSVSSGDDQTRQEHVYETESSVDEDNLFDLASL